MFPGVPQVVNVVGQREPVLLALFSCSKTESEGEVTTELRVLDSNPTNGALSAADMREQVNHIQKVMAEVMTEGEHYGVIPGTQKPTLLKPGAEKLCFTFRLDPEFDATFEKEGLHLTVHSKCTLFHIPTGARLGSGMGSCSSKESKYAYRQANRKCPKCNGEFIIKGKEEYGGGWLCFAKKGGCGAKFPEGAKEIEGQAVGRTPNEDIADQYNTILKMANKRSLVDAVLKVTAASDIFTQDLEEMPPVVENGKPAAAKTPEVVKPEPKTKKAKPPAEDIPFGDEQPEAYNGDEPSGEGDKTKRDASLAFIEGHLNSSTVKPEWLKAQILKSRALTAEDKERLISLIPVPKS